jgi:CheY-like chemotaxis protein
MNQGPPILVVDDEDTDVMILRMAAEKAMIPNPLVHVGDGMQAVAYLRGDPPYNDPLRYPVPALLLVDLKMPRMTGFDLLTWLAARHDLKHLPVVIFSASSHDSDILKARQLGASDYLVKPHRMEDLVKILKALHSRWLAKPTTR